MQGAQPMLLAMIMIHRSTARTAGELARVILDRHGEITLSAGDLLVLARYVLSLQREVIELTHELTKSNALIERGFEDDK